MYDRQIRLWGMAAQIRIQAAHILVVNLGGVASEVVKNLVLGGINSIEILDDSKVREEDFAAQFFLPNDDSIVGQHKLPHVINRIRDLNHRVTLVTNTNGTDGALRKDDYLKKFDLIIATELSQQQLIRLNHSTRRLNIPLYAAGIHGMFGYIFTDLIEHLSTSKKSRGNQQRQQGQVIAGGKCIVDVEEIDGNTEKVTVRDTFAPLDQIFEHSADLTTQLNRRQLKRLSPALPLILASFQFPRPTDPEASLDCDELQSAAQSICQSLKVSPDIVSSEYVTKFASQAFTEFSPTAAVLGGALAQDVIQFLSKSDSPINNVLILDGVRPEMPIFYM